MRPSRELLGLLRPSCSHPRPPRPRPRLHVLLPLIHAVVAHDAEVRRGHVSVGCRQYCLDLGMGAYSGCAVHIHVFERCVSGLDGCGGVLGVEAVRCGVCGVAECHDEHVPVRDSPEGVDEGGDGRDRVRGVGHEAAAEGGRSGRRGVGKRRIARGRVGSGGVSMEGVGGDEGGWGEGEREKGH